MNALSFVFRSFFSLTLLTAGSLGLTGCAQKFKLVPRESPGRVEVIDVKGKKAAFIRGSGFTVTLQARKGLEGKFEIEMVVKNLNVSRLDVRPERLQLKCWDGKQEQPMTFCRPEDVVSRKRWAQGSMMLATAFFNGIT
ncbi:MAG: hypothetical protein VKN33_05495, partial [Candidatus Sericytochromatia bacterium]|nr:hypothetical protein [Candidatus Sericytochromatia bacterium]